MENWQERTELLIGEERLKKLFNSHVLIVGLGGVGAIAAEMICRAGVGNLTIVDHDTIHASNRNRQIPALISTEGEYKADVIGSRLMDINSNLNLKIIKEYIIDDKISELLTLSTYDYVVDAIDTLSPKVFLIQNCLEMKYKIISSLGVGRKFDPSLIKIADISETYNCKLAYYLRKKLHKLDIYSGFKVVFSPEEVNEDSMEITKDERNKKSIVGTISYMPAMFGCYIASAVIREITNI